MIKPASSPASQIHWSHTTAAFMSSLRAGDDTAWKRVLTKTLWQAYAMGWEAGLRQHDCDELVQEVLLAATDGIGKFRHNGERGALRAWLRAIARTKLFDKCRERGIRLDLAEGGTQAQMRLQQIPAPPDPVSARSSVRDQLPSYLLRKIQREFAPANWEAFSRVVVNGEEAAEVARELNLSRNQVYKSISRILERLRQVMRRRGWR
jgi:RNA polymerase sigma-70 factor (ECF subfamily)